MTTEEKLKALIVVSNAKDKIDEQLRDMSCIKPEQINLIEINHSGHLIMPTESASRHIHALLSAMLENEKKVLIEKAKELMA